MVRSCCSDRFFKAKPTLEKLPRIFPEFLPDLSMRLDSMILAH
jgi:hypothetical protein